MTVKSVKFIFSPKSGSVIGFVSRIHDRVRMEYGMVKSNSDPILRL